MGLTTKAAENANDAGEAEESQRQEIQGYHKYRADHLPLRHCQDAGKQEIQGVGEKHNEGHTGSEQLQGEEHARCDTRVTPKGDEREVGEGDQGWV